MSDADLVRDAVASGQALPFSAIEEAVSRAVHGQIVGVGLARRSASDLVYKVKVLTEAGDLLSLTVDARSGAVSTVR